MTQVDLGALSELRAREPGRVAQLWQQREGNKGGAIRGVSWRLYLAGGKVVVQVGLTRRGRGFAPQLEHAPFELLRELRGCVAVAPDLEDRFAAIAVQRLDDDLAMLRQEVQDNRNDARWLRERQADIPALVELVTSAYRGDASRVGWTWNSSTSRRTGL